MTCCVEDIQFAGLLTLCDADKMPENGKWYHGNNGSVIRVMNKSWEDIKQEMDENGWQPLS